MTYRKRGHTIRWENGTFIRVTESGVATETEFFECHPEPSEELPAPDETALLATAKELATLNPERLILTHGIAEHEDAAIHWREETQRLHLALTHNRERALIDQANFDTTHIHRIARALRTMSAEEPQPPRLRLAPNVTAALIPHLLTLAPPNVRIVQTAGGIDGKGNTIVEATGNWPNWYRPSYRVRPIQAPLNLRLECSVTDIDESRPIAVALLGSVNLTRLRVLIEDGERSYPSTIRIIRIDAVASERTFYPHGAGSFGAELML